MMSRPHVFLSIAALFLAAVAVVPITAHAANSHNRWRVVVNLASYHTEQWAHDRLNERNPGLGLTYRLRRNWSLEAGWYKNSYDRTTVYAFADWAPLRVGYPGGWRVSLGIAGGIATGYRRSEVPCAPFAGAGTLAITAPNGAGLRLFLVPNMGPRDSGFVGFQVSVPFGDRE